MIVSNRADTAARETADVKIAQKIMSAHREAFRERFPGQVEHSLRLTAERLQACLNKPEGFVPSNTSTWPATAAEIAALAAAVNALHEIYRKLDHSQAE
tara:strand:- start:1284 stop:1580 length:297 start_codon:yes stop_codon:yes gene_type:complete